jgi:superfamily I DNA/RNA helicase/RecB family exonuclease
VTTVRLAPGPRPEAAPPPDEAQSAVIGRRQGEGALILLGGPGTGKTTTLVEAVAARVERDGVPPDAVLVLAPTRVAAAALRDRLSARLSRTVREPLARTPHSYAFGLLRRVRVLEGDVPPRLISGPEQDRVLADLLAGHAVGGGRVPVWPAAITDEVRVLRGFRDELRDLLMRAVERGLAPADLAALGRSEKRPDWVAAADVLAEYLDVTSLATPGAYDPAGIVDTAAWLLADDPELLAEETQRRALVVVDDAQELTAASVRLLEQLCGGGRDLLLAGDPDVTTQVFRGASPRLLAEAPDRFRAASGDPGAVVVLPTVWRHGPLLRDVAQRVASRIGSAGTVAHRSARPPHLPHPPHAPERPTQPADDASVQVRVLGSAAQEAAAVAYALRRWHLMDGIGWGRMAVVVRSTRSAGALRRALVAAGVPVAVPLAEVPVRDEAAVRPIRLVLGCALDPGALTAEVAVDLLTGPLGATDAVALRRLRQALRAEEIAGGGTRASDELLVDALADPARFGSLEPGVAAGARRVARVLAAAREAALDPDGEPRADATAETVLWAIWEAAGLAEAWRRTALAGGAAGARADRDLDAVVALFDAAARHVDRLPHAGPGGFLAYLEGQELPADTLAERAPVGSSVALVSAQTAAGREWDAVVVAGVQEGVWPDLRLRGSLLGAQALADLLDGRTESLASPGAGTVAQRRAVLDDELRTFHVAISRARRHLLVTAVSTEEELPSPFLDLVEPPEGDVAGDADPDPAGAVADAAGQDAEAPAAGEPGAVPGGQAAGGEVAGMIPARRAAAVPRALTLPALVAELRGVVVDPAADPGRRACAARELARLALAGVPGADPESWYGLAEPSSSGALRAPEATVTVSPSKVESFDRCALRWLLEQAGGGGPTSSAQGIGTLVHEVAQLAPAGDRARLRELLDERWPSLGLGTGWAARRERERAGRMVEKLADYLAGNGRELLAVEHDVQVEVGRAIVRGQVDRLERDADGRLVVVDLKTGTTPVRRDDLAEHAQLGVYQVAVEEGGFDDVDPGAGGRDEGAPRSGGAMLVQLGGKTKGHNVQPQPPLAAADDPRWAHRLVARVADGMAGEGFAATENEMCRTCPVTRSCPLQPEGRQVVE